MIGPDIPAHLFKKKEEPKPAEEDGSSDDDYGPAPPPDLKPRTEEKRVLGPSFPAGPPPEEDDSDDDVGPAPLPAGYSVEDETTGVDDFLQREERRRKAIEEDAKPKALKRDEWMLAPPEASDLLGSLDPTKKLKARQFQRNAQEKVTDRTLWTETPAERQQRLADEVSGKRKRAEGGVGAEAKVEISREERKRRKKDEEIRQQVDQYTKAKRGESLVDMHSKAIPASSSKDKEPAAIWDRDRDMGMGGRLMDERSRQNLIKDAKGLGSRFGHSKSGGYL